MHPPAVALDLDGVVWLGDEPIPGAADAVARLQRAGVAVVFVTNNALATVGQQEAKLAAHGIDATGAVLSSPMAAATLVEAGERVLVLGGPGLVEAVEGCGATVLSPAQVDGAGAAVPDAVVVGFHRDFDWDRMRVAATAVRAGARFLASNTDATFPTATGPVPGAGSIVAGVATAAGVAPVVAGKPHPPMAALVRDRCGADGVVVGDRTDTDGLLAALLGWPFALVLTGVTDAADVAGLDPPPARVAEDLAVLVDDLLAPTRTGVDTNC